MEYCAIKTCSEKNETNKGNAFYSFPRGLDVAKKWIRATGRPDWVPTEESMICSKHFRHDDFIVTESGHKCLKTDACPSENIACGVVSSLSDSTDSSDSTLSEESIDENNNEVTYSIEQLQFQEAFLFPSTVYPGSNEELDILKQFCESTNFSAGSRRPKLQSQLFQHPNDKDTSRKRKRNLGGTESYIKHQKRQIAIIQGQNRRLRERIKLMEAMIAEIKKFAKNN